MGCLSVALLFLAVFAACNARHTYLPIDKELTYHYHGLMTAGTHLPKLHNSAFVLDGTLHLQRDQNSTYLKFTDMKFKMFNGEYDQFEEFDGKMLEMPEDLKDLMKPFRVVQDTNGLVMGIATETSEPMYVVNIKKAMASMMQLDMEKIPTEVKKPITFNAIENSVYGKGKVYYTVKPVEDMVMIQKMQEPHSTQHMYTHLLTNVEYEHGHVKNDEPLTRDSQTFYNVGKVDGEWRVKNMESTSGIYYQPYQGHSDGFAIYVNHTMSFISAKPVETKLTLTSEKYWDGLAYWAFDLHDITGSFPDPTNGKRVLNKEKMLKIAEEMITEIAEYMEEDHINDKVPNVKRGQLMNRFMRLLNYFDLAEFEKLYESLLQNTKFGKWYTQIYYEILPHIGTNAAIYHMKNLIEGKKLKDEEADDMMQAIFSNVKFPNKKLVDDMAPIMNWGDDMGKTVRRAAILSFGSLLHKASMRHKRYNHELKWYGHQHHDLTNDYTDDMHLDEDFPSEKYYEKYVIAMMKKLKDAKDDGTRILYMEAIGNTRMQIILDLLTPAVKGEMWESNHLRMIAALVVSPLVLKDEELTYNLYWPMMTDDNLSTSLRIMSYHLIMQSQPSLNRLVNIEYELQSTNNADLYQYHYTYLRAMADTTDPRMEDFKVHIKQVLRYVQPPSFHGLTGYYQMDYTDEKYGFGEIFKGYLIHDKQENEIMMKIAYQRHDSVMPATVQWMFIRLSGMPHSFLKDIKLDLKSPTSMFKYDDFVKIFTHMEDFKDIRVCLTFGEYKRVVMTSHYDNTNLNELFEILAIVHENSYSMSEKMIEMDLAVSASVLMPTEMGFPAVFQYYVPEVHVWDINFVKEILNKVTSYQLDMDYKYWSHSRYGLSFYNPVADVWQGVNRYRSNDAEINMLLNMQINTQQQMMKLSWKRHNEPGKSDMIGMKSHTMTMVFVKDDKETGILKKSSPECNNWEIVSLGEDYRHNYLLHDVEESNTGYHLLAKAFDTERYISNTTDNIDMDEWEQATKMNHRTLFGKMFLYMAHTAQMEEQQPEPIIGGEMYRVEPLKDSSVTHLELAMRFNSEYKKDENFMLPAAKHNMRLTYSLKNKDVSTVTWDLNAIMDNNVDNMHNTIKVLLTRLTPNNPEMKICMDMDEKWETDKATLDWTISSNFMGEGTCTKADSMVNITAIAERMPWQDEHKYIYKSCRKFTWADIRDEQTLRCYMDHASLRKYTYKITTIVPKDQLETWTEKLLDNMKTEHNSYFVDVEKPEETNADVMMILEFPMTADVIDMKISTAEEEHVYQGIPANSWAHIGLRPITTQYNRVFRFMKFFGLTDTCWVQPTEVNTWEDDTVDVKMPKEWTMYWSNAEKDSKHGIWMKMLDDEHMAMKLTHKTHSLEIVTTKSGYDFFKDGKKMEANTYHHTCEFGGFDWVKETNVVSIFTNHFGMHILFDGHSIQMEWPQMDMEYFGHCFDQQK